MCLCINYLKQQDITIPRNQHTKKYVTSINFSTPFNLFINCYSQQQYKQFFFQVNFSTAEPRCIEHKYENILSVFAN